MNDELKNTDYFQEEKPKFWFYVPFVVVAAIAGVLWVIVPHDSTQSLTKHSNKSASQIAGQQRELNLFFPSDPGNGWSPEIRIIPGLESKREEILQCIKELVAGPEKNGKAVFPEGVNVSDVYLDTKGTAFINFEFEYAYPNIGGISAEITAINAIMKTIHANFPSIKAVQILCNGNEKESFTGHIDVSRPFLL